MMTQLCDAVYMTSMGHNVTSTAVLYWGVGMNKLVLQMTGHTFERILLKENIRTLGHAIWSDMENVCVFDACLKFQIIPMFQSMVN